MRCKEQRAVACMAFIIPSNGGLECLLQLGKMLSNAASHMVSQILMLHRCQSCIWLNFCNSSSALQKCHLIRKLFVQLHRIVLRVLSHVPCAIVHLLMKCVPDTCCLTDTK